MPRHTLTLTDEQKTALTQGIQGLFQKSGRGRKPAFAPKSEEEAEAEIQNIVGMSPDTISDTRCAGHCDRSREQCRG